MGYSYPDSLRTWGLLCSYWRLLLGYSTLIDIIRRLSLYPKLKCVHDRKNGVERSVYSTELAFSYRTVVDLWALLIREPTISKASRSTSLRFLNPADGSLTACKNADSNRFRNSTKPDATFELHLKIIQSSKFRVAYRSSSWSGRTLSDVPQRRRRDNGDAKCVVWDKVKKWDPLWTGEKE